MPKGNEKEDFTSQQKELNEHHSTEILQLKKQLEQQAIQIQKAEKGRNSMEKEIARIQNEFHQFQQKIRGTIKNQEKILVDIMNKFKKKQQDDIVKVETAIEKIREAQDTLKISFTINEKKIMDVIKNTVRTEMRRAVQGREKELLMKYWIEELKEIISNFESLKKKKPQEFSLELNQIAEMIEIFKQKLKK
ncbi:MAG: hypothetical protein EU544_05435 [Promethearchaeota archaeon]|nr:MAG: hypothetical protein EU544_05435 [Candidatus Lokiarchaeota archaeon]